MNKIFILPMSLILYFIFIANTGAAIKQDLSNCSKIENASDRLDCFDTLSKYYSGNLKTQPVDRVISTLSPVIPNSSSISTKTPTDPTPAIKKSQATKSQQALVEQKQSAGQDFGRIEKEDSVESIQSKLIGSFSGWKKGLLLKLENGQTWRVTSNVSGYKKMDNPNITIKTGFFGSFNAKVEGLNAMAKVKRVK